MKKQLFTAIAISAILGSGAAFADSNTATVNQTNNDTAYIQQIGSGNKVTISNTKGTGGNDFGTDVDPVLQQGNNNSFSFTQSSCCNMNHAGNNDVVSARQVGDNNVFAASLSNGAHNGVIQNFEQTGNGNFARVFRNNLANSSSEIGDFVQQGNSNWANISQESGAGNVVGSLTMIGNHNGYSKVESPSGRYLGAYIRQAGYNNTVETAYLEGDNNNVTYDSGFSMFGKSYYGGRQGIAIRQYGSDNGDDFASATMLGSDGNRLYVLENGNGNDFDLSQGETANSTQNYIVLDQEGNYNQATMDQGDAYNESYLLQDGDSNEANVTQGDSYNYALMEQNGSNNMIALNQTVSSNSATITQNGDANMAALTQTGSGNVAVISQSN